MTSYKIKIGYSNLDPVTICAIGISFQIKIKILNAVKLNRMIFAVEKIISLKYLFSLYRLNSLRQKQKWRNTIVVSHMGTSN